MACFEGIVGSGAGAPARGPAPVHAQLVESLADGLEADLGGGPAAFPPALGRSAQGPGAAGCATGTGPLVEQRPSGGGIEPQAGTLGPPGWGWHTGHAPGLEGMTGRAPALGGTAQLPGHLDRALPPCTGEQTLAPPQGKRIGGVPPGVEPLLFLGRQSSNRHGWFHAPSNTTAYELAQDRS